MAKKIEGQLPTKKVKEYFTALLNSCVEGNDGTWDPTGEGREAFEDMHILLSRLAKHFKVDISKAKEL